MQQEDKSAFELLKREIAGIMKLKHPGIKTDIAEWKGQEITDFQEDLLLKVKAQVSEKWFYTHIKSSNNHLPRIDVLNILSRYAGYGSWDEFKYKNAFQLPSSKKAVRSNRVFIWVPLLVAMILAGLYGLFLMFDTRQYSFSFFDTQTLQPIENMKIEVSILNQGESPMTYICDSTGKMLFSTDKSEIRMVIHSPYYRSDTLHRILKKFNNHENIGLRPNEYALMIHYFSQSNMRDWHKRQQQLERIIDNDALIYQIHGKNNPIGVELLNKQEFIDFISLPSASLKSLEILDIRNHGDKIGLLRYRLNEPSK